MLLRVNLIMSTDWGREGWCQCRRGKSLLKSGAKREILLVKSLLLDGQKTIRKWTNLVLAPPSHKVNSRVHQKPSALSAIAYGSQFLSSHQSTLMAVLFQEMISSSLGTACSSWKEAVTNFGYPSKEHFCFKLSFRVPTLQLSARSMAFSGILLTAATAVVWAA